MASYFTLSTTSQYLRNFGPLAAATDGEVGGITQGDLARCETDAFNEINSRLAGIYDTSTWLSSVPDIIATIANLLGSSYAWTMKFLAHGIGSTESAGLRQMAVDLIEEIITGDLEVIAGGQIQSRVLSGLRGTITSQ